jgi:hypothetical protein
MVTGVTNNAGAVQHQLASQAEEQHCQAAITTGKKDVPGSVESVSPANNIDIPRDIYTRSGERVEEPTGTYRLEEDENGNRKIVVDDAESTGTNNRGGAGIKEEAVAKGDEAREQPEEAGNSKKKEETEQAETCTCNTDKVDDEIEKLKEEKQQIEQQLKYFQDDEEKRKELEQQLSAIEAELSAKDNDNYRRQYATFS